jgi:mucin-19
VGYLNSSNSEISNSNHTVGLVKGYNYVGGLAGEAYGQLGVNVSANSTPTYNTFVSSNVEGNGELTLAAWWASYGSGHITNVEMTGNVTGWRTAGIPDWYTNGTFTRGHWRGICDRHRRQVCALHWQLGQRRLRNRWTDWPP